MLHPKKLSPSFFILILISLTLPFGCHMAGPQKSQQESQLKKLKSDAEKTVSEIDENIFDPLIAKKILESSFKIENNKSTQDCSLQVSWDPVPGIENYKLYLRAKPLVYYDKIQDKFLKKEDPHWGVINFRNQKKFVKLKLIHYINHCNRNPKNTKTPTLYKKYDYIVSAFSGPDQNSKLLVKMQIPVQGYLLPENPKIVLKDVYSNMIPGLYETDGFCGKQICNLNDPMNPKSNKVKLESKGLQSGQYIVQKNGVSITYKWEDYSNFESIKINGTLTGKVSEWNGRKKYGKKVTIHGNLKVTGLYVSNIGFNNVVVYDQEDLAKISGINPNQNSGSLSVTYHGKTEILIHGKDNFYRNHIKMLDTGQFKKIKRLLKNNRNPLSKLFKKPSYLKL